jgi:segregation and condensation protein B
MEHTNVTTSTTETFEEPPFDESLLIETAESQESTPFLGLPRSEQRSAVEALIFASEEPLTAQMLYDVLIAPSLLESIKPEKPEKIKAGKNNRAANGQMIHGMANSSSPLHHSPINSPINDTVTHAEGVPEESEDKLEAVEVARLNVEPPVGYVEYDNALYKYNNAAHSPTGDAPPEDTSDAASEQLALEPVSVREHRQHLALVHELVTEINAELEQTGRAFRIVLVAAQAEAKSEKNEKGDKTSKEAASMGYQFATTAKHGELLSRLVKSKSKKRLSQAALETLAIVAYRQPVSKPELEVIRGVNSSEVINKLLEKNLVTIVGRAETVGKPLLYGTTDEFLRLFGLRSLDGLPKPRELEELMENRADIIEAIQTAKDAAATVIRGTKNTLTDTMPERTTEEIAVDR